MSYMHIENLYKDQTILMFKECYALEKIHGTSAHISWRKGVLSYFSGGAKHDHFAKLFDQDKLATAFALMGHEEVTVFGEAYGGKLQGMSETYGKDMKFIVFDVKVGESWLSVPSAADVAQKLGLEFVWYTRTSTVITALDALRDRDSEQAVRNGTGAHMSEGVVLRPVIEVYTNSGRVISKHKRAEFGETKTPRPVDAAKLEVLTKADAIATEWVTPMRLSHVTDKLGAKDITETGRVIKAMLEDIEREGKGEIEFSTEAKKAISQATATMFKKSVTAVR